MILVYKNKLFKDIFNSNKIINKLIISLTIVLLVALAKSINTEPTNNIVDFIERNIYYDFSVKEDGKKIGEYVIKFLNGSKANIEKFTVEIYNNLK